MEKGITEYKKLFEKRRHRRAPLAFPVIIKSPHGSIRGVTESLSVSGLSLLVLVETTYLGDKVEITLRLSEGFKMQIICEVVWAGKINYKRTMYNAFRVKFINMSSNDRVITAFLVEKYYLV